MNKWMWVVVVIIALLIGAYFGYYFEKQKMDTLLNMQRADMQRQIDNEKAMIHTNPTPTVLTPTVKSTKK